MNFSSVNELIRKQEEKTRELHYRAQGKKTIKTYIGRMQNRANLLSKSNNNTVRKFLLNVEELTELGIKDDIEALTLVDNVDPFLFLEIAYKYGVLVNRVGAKHYLTYTMNNLRGSTKNVKKTTFGKRLLGMFRRSPTVKPIFLPNNTIVNKLEYIKRGNEQFSSTLTHDVRATQLFPLFLWSHLPDIIDIIQNKSNKKMKELVNDLKYLTGINVPTNLIRTYSLNRKNIIKSYLEKIETLRKESNYYKKYIVKAYELLTNPPTKIELSKKNPPTKIELSKKNINELLNSLEVNKRLNVNKNLTPKQKRDLELLLQVVYDGVQLKHAEQGVGLKNFNARQLKGANAIHITSNILKYTPRRVKQNIETRLGESTPTIIFFTEDMIEAEDRSQFRKVDLGDNVYYTTLEPELIKRTIGENSVNVNNVKLIINE